ncbi:MAG: hypothetical protein H0V34_03215 [Gammaproteobacteria bacterium]|nr:hypothetical protein [Gammaproteobacteria bacterium]
MPRGGAKPGERRGGRQKGTRNKRTLAVIDRLDVMGCDPIAGMARIAMDETAELAIRAQMFKELAQYVAPKRKAIEVTGEDGGPIKGEFTLTAWLDEHSGKTLGPPSER